MTKKLDPNKLEGEEFLRYALKELGHSDYDIDLQIEEYNDLKDWEPITFQELYDMDESEYDNLMSYCWKEGNPRCDTIGISDVSFTFYTEEDKDNYKHITVGDVKKLEWSDGNGDPTLYGYPTDTKIDNIGDGYWNYGLYKKIEE